MAKPGRILIADYNPDVADAMKCILEGEGHTTEIVETAREVRARLAQASYDLVLVDEILPDMRGSDLIDSLKDAPCRFALFSLYPYRYIGNGHAYNIIEKPFTKEDFLVITRKLLA